LGSTILAAAFGGEVRPRPDDLTGSEAKCQPDAERDSFTAGKFPDNFKWSFATAAYQIEGAWNADGKGKNIWDTFSQTDGNVQNNDTGNDACKSYYNMVRDVSNMKSLGVKDYRFSLSWARLCPTGKCKDTSGQERKGIDHYHKFLDLLIEADIEPFVTLYHWDLPQNLETTYKGWEGAQVVEDFGDYARLVFSEYGSKVKNWITLNEAEVVCDLGYGIGVFAPGKANLKSQFDCRHHTVLAHTKAYHIYNDEFRATQKGQIGITMNTDWYEGFDESKDNYDAAQRWMDLQLGFWADPIYLTGDYPESVLKNNNDTILQRFTAEQIAQNKGAADFFGLNHYTTRLVTDGNAAGENKGVDWTQHTCPQWPQAGSEWLYSVPWGYKKLLTYIHNRYDSEQYPIYVTENGVSSRGNGTDFEPELDDQWRIDHYTGYIGQMKRAIDEDKANVQVYTAWSLMDNFEWASGYTERFGMVWVNFTDPARPTYFKDSALFYSDLITTNELQCSDGTNDGTCKAAPTTTTAQTTTTSSAQFVSFSALFFLIAQFF